MELFIFFTYMYYKLKGPALPVKQKTPFFLAFYTPWPSMSVHKNFSPIGPAGYTQHIFVNECLNLLYRYTSWRARRCTWKTFLKFFKNEKKYLRIFFSMKHPPDTHECPQKIEPNRFSRLAGYRQHIYINTNHVSYYIDVQKKLIV